MNQNVVAFLKGFSIFIAATLTSLLLLLADSSANIAVVVWPALMLASCVTTYSAKSFRFVLAIALAVPSAVTFGLQNVGWELITGNLEISVVEDFVLVLIMTLPYCLGLCVAGGACGMAVHLVDKSTLTASRLKPIWGKSAHSESTVKLLAKS